MNDAPAIGDTNAHWQLDFAVRTDAAASSLAEMQALPRNLTFDRARSALVIVDMQNDFCTSGGWLDSTGVDVHQLSSTVIPINTLTAAFRANDLMVIWLNWGNRSDRRNLPMSVLRVYDPESTGSGIGNEAGSSSAVLTEGSWGAQTISALTTASEDVRVSKYRMSGFFDTPLESILRVQLIQTVFFAGVNADQCVLATLADAANHGYDAVMIEDATATTSPKYCFDAAIYNVRQCFGFTTSSEAVIATLTSASKPNPGSF